MAKSAEDRAIEVAAAAIMHARECRLIMFMALALAMLTLTFYFAFRVVVTHQMQNIVEKVTILEGKCNAIE